MLGHFFREFAKEREKVENRRNFIKLRYEQQLKRMCDSYLDWILKGGNVFYSADIITKHCFRPFGHLHNLFRMINPFKFF